MNRSFSLSCLAAIYLSTLVLAGCSARSSGPPKTFDAFPTVLYVGKEMTRADMVRIYPGCAKYLAALGEASAVPLLERVRGTWPADSPDFMYPENADADWTTDSPVTWGPYQA